MYLYDPYGQKAVYKVFPAVLAYVCLSLAFGQTTGTTQPSGSSTPIAGSPISVPVSNQVQPESATIQAYQQEQRALVMERQALVAQGATQDQLAAWQQQNAARFATQRQRTDAMALASAMQVVTVKATPHIPDGASPTLRDFLTTQAALINAQIDLRNQLAKAMPLTATSEQVRLMQQQGESLFLQQHAEDLRLQAQRAQILASEASQASQSVLMPTPISQHQSSVPTSENSTTEN